MRRFLKTFTGALTAFGAGVTVFFGLVYALAIFSSWCMLVIADPTGVAIPYRLASSAFECGLAILALGIATYTLARMARLRRR